MNTEQTPVRDFSDWMKILPQIRKKTIPEMTHPLSKSWDQPSASKIKIDDKIAEMDQETFDQLKDYSLSYPSGVYEGKMWKSRNFKDRKSALEPIEWLDEWYLHWFGFSEDPGKCSNNTRVIKITNPK